MKRPPRTAVSALVIVGVRGRMRSAAGQTAIRVHRDTWKPPRSAWRPRSADESSRCSVNEGDARDRRRRGRPHRHVRHRALRSRRAHAERDQAAAQLRLLEAGARPEDVRQARAQVESAQADLAGRRSGTAVGRGRSPAVRSSARLERRLAQAARRCGDEACRGSRARCGGTGRARAAAEALARLRAGSRGGGDSPPRVRGWRPWTRRLPRSKRSSRTPSSTSPVSGIVTAKTGSTPAR